MKRGEIYFANLNPTIRSEIRKKRPVFVISNDTNNDHASTVTIIPITSNVKKVYPFEVLLNKKRDKFVKTIKSTMSPNKNYFKTSNNGQKSWRD